MPQRPSPAARLPAAAVALTALALVGVGAGFSNPDGLVTEGFATALMRPADGATPTGGTAGASGLTQLSGTEEFWLDRRQQKPGTVPVAWSKSVAVGDRITIASASGERRYEVVDIRPLGDLSPDGAARPPLLLVTCEDATMATAPPIRFVIEGGGSGDTGRRAAHAL